MAVRRANHYTKQAVLKLILETKLFIFVRLFISSTMRLLSIILLNLVVIDFVNQYLLQYYHSLRKRNNGLKVTKIRDKYF